MENAGTPAPTAVESVAGTRKRKRDSLFLKAIIHANDGMPPFEVRVRNLSAGGMMAEAPACLPNGEPVAVELRNIGRIRGKVAWNSPERFGIAFEVEIDPQAARMKSGGQSGNAMVNPRYARIGRAAR